MDDFFKGFWFSVVILFLGLGFSSVVALDVEIVGSFRTEELTPAPVFSIAVDEGNGLLLVGATDGDILEVTPEGERVRSLIDPPLRQITMANGLAVIAGLDSFFHQGVAGYVAIHAHERAGAFAMDFILSHIDDTIQGLSVVADPETGEELLAVLYYPFHISFVRLTRREGDFPLVPTFAGGVERTPSILSRSRRGPHGIWRASRLRATTTPGGIRRS